MSRLSVPNGKPAQVFLPSPEVVDVNLTILRSDETVHPKTGIEKELCELFANNRQFHKIYLENIGKLKQAFSQAVFHDPYSISPAYYALTGRRGLWFYQENEKGGVMLCLHPNEEDCVLVFPPFGEDGQKALKGLIKKLSKKSVKIELGRIPANDLETKKLLSKVLSASRITDEAPTVLDWTFPVHTISCEAVVKREGPKFQPLRNEINSAKRSHNLSVRSVNFQEQGTLTALRKLSVEWETATHRKTSNGQDMSDISSDYFIYLARMGQYESLNLRGLILSVEGRDVGFSIWEPPVGKANVANLFAAQVSDFSLKNVATYLTYKTAKTIRQNGGQLLCLGGSETENMDRFKRKFVPQASCALKSITVSPG